jgi:hypothetical protein
LTCQLKFFIDEVSPTAASIIHQVGKKDFSTMFSRSMKLSALGAMLLMSAATEGSTGGVSASTEGAAAEAARKRAPASNFLPIVRGRLPLMFVHAIRFDPVLNAMGNSDLATKFATSVGKVFDIKKNKNFAYVGKDFVPSAEDVKAAEAWVAQVGAANAKGQTASGDATLMGQTVEAYKAKGLATAEQAAAFAATRTTARAKPVAAPAAAGTATEGKTEAVQSTAKSTGDDLLG